MKVDNLKRASELIEELRVINSRIETAGKATNVTLDGGNSFSVKTEKMKYSKDTILSTIKPLFMEALAREKNGILNEIEALE